jgi:hypothetical protein
MMLAYMAGFAARGDSVVASTFLSLWVTQAALAAGKSQEDALAYAGTVSGVAQTCALLFGPVIGIISDRYNRILGFTLASLIGAVGYLMTAFQTDVFSDSIFIGASLLGCGEIGKHTANTSQTLRKHFANTSQTLRKADGSRPRCDQCDACRTRVSERSSWCVLRFLGLLRQCWYYRFHFAWRLSL